MQTIEGVSVLESLSTIFHYSTVVCLQHQLVGTVLKVCLWDTFFLKK